MKQFHELFPGWYSSDPLDFEYNQYRLNAYIQHVKESFGRTELYPVLEDVKIRFDEVTEVTTGAWDVQSSSKGKVKGIDFKNLELIYQKEFQPHPQWDQVQKTLDYALPRLKKIEEEGREIENFVSDNCEIEPVGLLPLYRKEGYLIYFNQHKNEIFIFKYSGRILQQDAFGKVVVKLQFVQKLMSYFGQTFTGIKNDLIRKFRELPNPATFLMVSKFDFPVHSALLPVAGKVLSEWID